MTTIDKYARAKERRDAHTAAILASKARFKVVVAGPGTGKTFLFKKVLEGKQKSLTLSFINALVDDLSIELYGLSEVRTLHSFARSLLGKLWKRKDIKVFPRLADVIQADLHILHGVDVDFAEIFNTRDDANAHLEFYRQRKKYYNESYGYTDIVFAAVRYLEEHPDQIPVYDQVVVDEFQDFNLLEASLIDLLAQKSPMLLAGDDDQALYDFKHADPAHIRKLHAEGSDYESFNLPLCSRCTRVIVGAANDVIEAASARSLLKGRINKPYEYFDDEKKDSVSDAFPTLTHKQLFSSQFGWFIETKLDELATMLRESFSVLVISPTKTQAKSLANSLAKRGFRNVTFEDRHDSPVGLLDGLKLLLIDDHSNLGWRIATASLMNETALKRLLEETAVVSPPALSDIVPMDVKKRIKSMLKVLRKVRDGKDLTKDDHIILDETGVEPLNVGMECLKEELNADGAQAIGPGLRRLPIKVTTIQGSKGLAADVVFITHVDDAFFIDKKGITDKNVCNFVVALTRGKKKVFLMSSREQASTFVEWISADSISSG